MALTCKITGKKVAPPDDVKNSVYLGECLGGDDDVDGYPCIRVKLYAVKENNQLTDLLWRHREPGVTATHITRGLVYWHWTLRAKDFAWIKLRARVPSDFAKYPNLPPPKGP